MPPTRTIEGILKETKIYQILRPKCVNAGPEATLQQALDLMHQEKSGYVVIRDEHLRVLGMFTERDVLMKVLRKGVDLKEPVKKFMNTDLIELSKADTVGAAIDAMRPAPFLPNTFPMARCSAPCRSMPSAQASAMASVRSASVPYLVIAPCLLSPVSG